MTTVLVLTNCPPKLRGDMTKWFVEINTGVYVGNISKRIREELWKRICDNIKKGQATMVLHSNNEQQMDFYVHNTTWEPVDFDGIKLMRRPSPERMSQNKDESVLKPGFSNASKKRFQRGSRGVETPSNAYVVIDIETTGLNPQTDRIIEYAALRVENRKVTGEFEMLASQETELKSEIIDLTGITDELLRKEGKSPEEALREFLEFIGKNRIVGHNLAFDMPFLINECRKYNLTPPSARCEDTLTLAKRRISGVRNYKLTTLAEHFSIPYEAAHRALSDCRITNQLYEKLNATFG